MLDPLLHLWHHNQQLNRQLLSVLEPEWLGYRYAPRVRTIGQVWGHIHQVRLMWLGAVGLDQSPELERIRSSAQLGPVKIAEHLDHSANAFEGMFREVEQRQGKIPGFPSGLLDFVGYLIAHESHHRGQIIAALRINKHPLTSDAIHALWNWQPTPTK